MAEVGLRLTMTENVSSLAPKVSSALREISQEGDEMRTALDLGDLEQRYKSFADRVEKVYDTQRGARQERADERRRQSAEERAEESEKQRRAATMRTAPSQLMTGAGRAAQQAGGGDVVGAGAGLMGTVGALLKSIGPVGWIISALGAAVFAGAAIEQQYEKQLPGAMQLSAALGRLGKDTDDAGAVFMATMEDVVDSAKEFGYTLEEAMPFYAEFARTGGRRPDYESRGMRRVMEYGRGFGADPASLAGFLGTFQRFGGTGNILGVAAGGLQQSGMGPGRYQEFLDATLSVFEEGLSRGVVRGFEDIIGTQTWFAQLGEAFTGQTGINIYKKMQASLVGATALTSEQDAIMFRAASDVVRRESVAGNFGYIDVMRRMESGLDVPMFEAIRREVQGMAANKDEQIGLYRSIFKVGYEVAAQLPELQAGKAIREIKQAQAPSVESDELRILRSQEEIAQDIRRMGNVIVSTKAWTVELASTLLGGLTTLLGLDPDRLAIQKQREDRLAYETSEAVALTRAVSTLPGGASFAAGALETLLAGGVVGGPGVTEAEQTAAIRIKSMIEGLSPEQRHALSSYTGTVGAVAYEGVFDYLEAFGLYTSRPGREKAAGVTGYTIADLPNVLEELTRVLNSLDKNVAADRNTNIIIEEKTQPSEADQLNEMINTWGQP